jgi:hypothetical protein
MEQGSLFSVPSNLGSPAADNPWRLTGEGKMSRSDLTQSSDDELLYVYLKNGSLELVRENYTLEQYTPEDLRIARNTLFALHGYAFKSQELLRHFSRYFWYDPDPNVPNSTEIFTGPEQTLLRYIMGQEKVPGHQSQSLSLFWDKFRQAVLRHDWPEVFEYLDPDYRQDRLDDRFGGDRSAFLSDLFGGVDQNRITDLEYESYPEALAEDKVVDRLGLTVSASGSRRDLRSQIRRADGGFRLVGPHDGVTNYEHGSFPLRAAHGIVVKMRSVGDPYLRCYSAWIQDGSGGYINLDDGLCDPQRWKSSHCSCPTVAGTGERRYDLSRYTQTPYTGEVVVAVSSYVGYWRVEVEAAAQAGATAPATPAQSGRSWSTPTD